ncbi:hypothetical protein AGMMS49991_04360 [Spirochaetia bacterium]|nr:hypothetical protein AGMMS49991_04360 [Spirochaetia bacterium]
MNTWLFWLVPPAIGAVIGYVTNAVAIKMLFRPLKEIRLFGFIRKPGLRLPFTPGILPRQRHKLADNIGAMVERELLTPEILRERLGRGDVRQSIGESIAAYTGKLLDTPIGLMSRKKLPEPGSPADSGDPQEIKPQFGMTILRDFLHSPGFNALLDKLLESLFDPARSIRDILGEEKMTAAETRLEGLIRSSLNVTLPQMPVTLRPVLEDAFPQISRSIIQFLQRAEIHRELEIQGRVFLNNAIDKLSVFQRFFVSAGQYDKTLRDRMPEIIDDLIGQLEALLAGGELRDRLIGYAGDTVLALASEAQVYNRMVRFASDMVFSYSDLPLGDLLKKLGVGESGSPDSAGLGQKIRFFIQDCGTGKIETALALALRGFREEHRDMRLGTLCAIDDEKKGRIDALIQDKLFMIVEEQIDGVLKTINVRTMVSDRIDALDMIKVERIVLDVMANQLKWINVFGGILGALIGIFQAAFSWVLGR